MVLVNVESLVIGLLPMPSVITLRVAEHREDLSLIHISEPTRRS